MASEGAGTHGRDDREPGCGLRRRSLKALCGVACPRCPLIVNLICVVPSTMSNPLASLSSRGMRNRSFNTRSLHVSAIVVLAALLFRAYIPVGFMPASIAPFRLELCPAFGMSVPAHHLHHHDSRHHADLQDCPFGSAPAQGPVSDLLVFDPPGQIPFLEAFPAGPKRLVTRSLRSHQPRGPPCLA